MNHYQRFLRQHPEHAEELEERAAIMEYDGGKKRDSAEANALWRIKDKYELWGE
jgi:hypothetical protein